MLYKRLLILLGVLIIIIPLAGLPSSLLAWAIPVLGLLVLGIGVLLVPSKKEALHETNEGGQ